MKTVTPEEMDKEYTEFKVSLERFFGQLAEEYAGGTYVFLNELTPKERKQYMADRFIEHLNTLKKIG